MPLGPVMVHRLGCLHTTQWFCVRMPINARIDETPRTTQPIIGLGMLWEVKVADLILTTSSIKR